MSMVEYAQALMVRRNEKNVAEPSSVLTVGFFVTCANF